MTIAAALLAFLPVAVSLVLVPGVNNLVVLRETVAHGRPGGYAAIAGTSMGILAWSAAVALGLGTLATRHPQAFTGFQVVGAVLLVTNGLLSGLRVLRQAKPTSGHLIVQSREHSVMPRRTGTPHGGGRSALSVGRRDSFRTAATTSLANPRCPVTAVSVLPQFVAPGSAAAMTTLALGALWTLVAGLWNVVGVQLAHRGRGLLSQPRAKRTIEGVSAAALVAVGISVASAAA
ncbi:LysE family translocator [Terrabacter terrigena]|uniref:LysE family translocator n=1 Tax=Terrabacter terrigena TaxID=574718 RepID=A0ABW3MUH8_9MICO